MIGVDVLARPITDLAETFGSGVLPCDCPAGALRASSAAIDAIHALGRTGIGELAGAWTGAAADSAVRTAEQLQSDALAAADRGNAIATVVADGSETVRAGAVELQAILQSFVSLAASAGPTLGTPPGQLMLLTAALEHLGRALDVAARVCAELAAHTARMNELVAPETRGGAVPSPVGLVGTGESPYGTAPGNGAEIVLPDGSTTVAPNPEAAAAVRNALSQQGVPYVWGGTTPGQGLDCSGLTQWAYGEAGVALPRLAQEQGVGTPVDPDDLMPGDLAVWDGHVAMVIGDGKMIEAGDPVQVSSIRTTNSGMGFQGFYRPTSW